MRTSLAFYRGKVKVYETPAVEGNTIDAADRKAALFQFEVPAGSFTPGLYICQINIVERGVRPVRVSAPAYRHPVAGQPGASSGLRGAWPTIFRPRARTRAFWQTRSTLEGTTDDHGLNE